MLPGRAGPPGRSCRRPGTVERLDRGHQAGPTRGPRRQHAEQRAEHPRVLGAVGRPCPGEQRGGGPVGHHRLAEPAPDQVTERVHARRVRCGQDGSGVPADGLEARPAVERGEHAVDVGAHTAHPVRA